MTVLLDSRPGERDEVRTPLRTRRPVGEIRRPPTRAPRVAGRPRLIVASCRPRRVLPRWPWLAAAGLVVALLVTGLGVFADGMPGAAVPERTATVTVGSGRSLWDLAREYAPGADADAVVTRIRQLNGLGDAAVVSGLPLTVPIAAQLPGDGS
ncbi:MAG TPA: hypothetical protein VJ870_20325 [Amycolatopsis sp.]|nr:hypothetical protein [Amycolatopsis sp.]